MLFVHAVWIEFFSFFFCHAIIYIASLVFSDFILSYKLLNAYSFKAFAIINIAMKSNSQLGISCIYKTICLLLLLVVGRSVCVCVCLLNWNHIVWLVSTSNSSVAFPHFHFLKMQYIHAESTRCCNETCVWWWWWSHITLFQLLLRSILLSFKFLSCFPVQHIYDFLVENAVNLLVFFVCRSLWSDMFFTRTTNHF